MSTVSLQLIVKDEYDAVVHDIVQQAIDYFDQINITVSDKPTCNKLQKIVKGVPALEAKLNIKYREWNNNFADARNANYALSTTDYTFWLDADDRFDYTTIPQLVALADENNIDAIFLPYNYAYDENGNVITRHWRERLVKNGLGFTWKGAIHETYLTDQDFTSHKVENPVIHTATAEHAKDSLARNHAILRAQVEGVEEPDPRYLCYYGASLFSLGEYQRCIEILIEYLNVGGSVEDSYRSLSLISEAAYHLGQHDAALEYASKCVVMKPEYPMGYWLLAQYEADQSNWKEALEWVRVSLTKPDPDTLSVYDPTARERAILIGAQAEFMLGHYNNALAFLRKIPKNESAQELLNDFTEEADAETFTKLIPRIRKFFRDDSSLWAALCDDMRFDARLKPLRNIATPPGKWADNTIVFFCGQGYEEWGPHTLDKGMGGSEEAVVYLSRELAKLGYAVTVFGEASLLDDDSDTGDYPVRYRHWKEIDTRDEFNIFISWRAPQYLERINAKVKLADIHDVLPESIVKNYPDVTYLFKSDYHKNLYGDVDSRVIGNGIKKEQF